MVHMITLILQISQIDAALSLSWTFRHVYIVARVLVSYAQHYRLCTFVDCFTNLVV